MGDGQQPLDEPLPATEFRIELAIDAQRKELVGSAAGGGRHETGCPGEVRRCLGARPGNASDDHRHGTREQEHTRNTKADSDRNEIVELAAEFDGDIDVGSGVGVHHDDGPVSRFEVPDDRLRGGTR